MNAKTNLTLGAAVAALFAATAISQAADAVFEAPPAPPAAPIISAPINTWEGPYAGISLGYGFSGETEIAPAGTVDTDGFVGNVFGGWNWQSGSFVYGIEGDVGYNGMEDDNFNYSVENGVEGSLRARLGVAATENVLLYATAGGAGGRTEVTAPAGVGFAGGSDTQTLWGWTAGVGTDVKFTEQAFGRLEYRYTDLGDETFDFGGATAEVGSTSHKVMVGVGMKF